jgi:hypothetical protein
METKKLQLPALLVLLMILTNFNLATAQTVIFQDDFESGNLDNWTIIDSDGDSKKWEIYQPIDGANSGSYAAVSWSWDEEIGGLNPDDWMISPQVAGAKFMKFFIQSGTGKTDNYAIYASTTGNDISDFSVVYEAYLLSWQWRDRNIILPEGTKYVAFRHFDSKDKNRIMIDDVIIMDKIPCGTVKDLTATVNENNTVTLNWAIPPESEQAPESSLKFYFYDGDDEIGYSEEYKPTSWKSPVLPAGTHSLGVQIRYYSGNTLLCSSDIARVSVNIEELSCPTVSNLTALATHDDKVYISWTIPTQDQWPQGCTGRLNFFIFKGTTLLQVYSDNKTFWWSDVLPLGTHSFGVVTKYYGNGLICESDTARVSVTIYSAKAYTEDVTNVTQSTTVLNGRVEPGTDVIAEKGFEWKQTTGGTYADLVANSADNTFTGNLTGLTPKTKYTYRAYAKIGSDKIYGGERSFTTLLASGIENITQTVNIYPNPVKDILNIKSDNTIESLELYDALGRKVLSQSGESATESTVNVSSLKDGIYILQLRTASGIAKYKVVVSK